MAKNLPVATRSDELGIGWVVEPGMIVISNTNGATDGQILSAVRKLLNS